MADQVRLGTVFVENGVATVRHTWELLLVSITGTFLLDEVVTWPGGGSGIVSRWDVSSATLYMRRTAGPDPVAADTITGPSGDGDVSSLGIDSPPSWDTLLSGESDIRFTTYENTSVYQVSGVPLHDSFALTTVYGEVTEHEKLYGLSSDVTTLGFLLAAPGNIGAVSLFSGNWIEAQRRFQYRAARRSLAGDQAVIAGSWVTVLFDTDDRDTDGFAVAGGKLKVPVGSRTANLYGSVEIDDGVTAGLRILKNGVVFAGMKEVRVSALAGAAVGNDPSGLLYDAAPPTSTTQINSGVKKIIDVYDTEEIEDRVTVNAVAGTFTIIEDGRYLVGFNVSLEWDVVITGEVQLYIDGVAVDRGMALVYHSSVDTVHLYAGAIPVDLVAGEVLDLRLSHDSGAPANGIYQSLSFWIVRAATVAIDAPGLGVVASLDIDLQDVIVADLDEFELQVFLLNDANVSAGDRTWFGVRVTELS